MVSSFSFPGRCICALLIACIAASLSSASIEISATDSGWYRNDGYHNSVGVNYFAQANTSTNNRNFFVFDLSGVTNSILSAVIRLENPVTLNNGVASTYTLSDVVTDVSTLMADQTNATAIYADLGTGVTYGSASFGGTIGSGMIEISLNSAAIAAMNATSGLYALGGSLSVVGSTPASVFSYTSGPQFVKTLVLEVEEPAPVPGTGIIPEPSSMLAWSGIGLLAWLGVVVRSKAQSSH